MGYGVGWIGMWVYPILIIGVVFFIIYLFTGRGAGKQSTHGAEFDQNYSARPESALDLLKKRYAKGEITKDEFERMKRDLL